MYQPQEYDLDKEGYDKLLGSGIAGRNLKIKVNKASKKAIDKLGYKITPLREGLTETIEWYKDYIEKEKNKS